MPIRRFLASTLRRSHPISRGQSRSTINIVLDNRRSLALLPTIPEGSRFLSSQDVSLHNLHRGIAAGNATTSYSTMATMPTVSPHGTSPPPRRFHSTFSPREAAAIPPLRRHSTSTTSASDPPTPKSLRTLLRPFLRACHPDAMMSSASSPDALQKQVGLSTRAKQTNLRAVQTLNGLADALEDLIERCVPPSHYSYIYGDDNNNDDGGKRKEKKYQSGASLPELKSQYEIEFLLPNDRDDDRDNHDEKTKLRKRRNRREPLTSRSITMEFPKELRRDVKKWALSTPASFSGGSGSRLEEEAFTVAMQLRQHAVYEFGRLLKIAGMEFATHRSGEYHFNGGSEGGDGVGLGNMRQRLQKQKRRKEEWTLTDHFLHELGIDPTEDDDDNKEHSSRMTNDASSSFSSPRSAFFGRGQKYTPPSSSSTNSTSPFYSAASPSSSPRESTAPPPAYSHPKLRAQRQRFMNSIDWSAFRDSYDRAFLDAKADFDTMKMNLYNVHTREGRERREKLVGTICGGVRVWTPSMGRGGHGNEKDDRDDDWDEHDIPEGLDVVQQLIAIRRLSMILYDNFDYLQMEEMGRMWEQLVIVLTPPRSWRKRRRKLNGSSSAYDDGEDSDQSRRRWRKPTKWERNRKKREKLKPANRDVMRYFAVNHGRVTTKISSGDGSVSTTDDYESLGRENEDQDPNDNDSTSKDDDGTNDKDNHDKDGNNDDFDNEYTTTYPESGYKFSYGTTADQGTGQVTAYIPIDFGDEELVRLLYTHLYDYFDTCCGDVGFLTVDGTGDVVANDAGYSGYRGVGIRGMQGR